MLTSLSILIPTFNDEETIESVVSKADVVGKKLAKKHEVIVCNDGSTNAIPHILKALQKKLPSLRILTHESNKGYGESIKDLYYAGKHDWLVTIPGDDQIDPEEIGKLVPFADKQLIIMGKRGKREDHILRQIQSRTYNFLLKLLFHIPTTDVNTIRLMNKSVMEDITLTMTSAFVDAELILRAKKAGYSIREIPIIHKSRTTPGASGGKFFKTILPTIIDCFRFFLSK